MNPSTNKKKSQDASEASSKDASEEIQETEDSSEKPDKKPGVIKTIHSISGFLSSFVIGVAGLIATSLYQFNQSKLAQRQAESQEQIAKTQAENNWKIERAKILSQNLQALTTRGGDTVEQRYGVLLSLSRGKILEPEVATSYALELGKDNPDYMRNVLSNLEYIDYRRIFGAYAVTCEQRYGVSSSKIEDCKHADELSLRSNMLASIYSEEVDKYLSAIKISGKLAGPFELLTNEREVQNNLPKFAGLFGTFLQETYEKHQWSDFEDFLQVSSGSHLLGALALATWPESESSLEQSKLHEIWNREQEWLRNYLFHSSCDTECKSRVGGFMLSNLEKSGKNYHFLLKLLLQEPLTLSSSFVNRLYNRFLYCQIDSKQLGTFRDQILLPSIKELLAKPKPDSSLLEQQFQLLAFLPEPSEVSVLSTWKAVIEKLPTKQGEHSFHSFAELHRKMMTIQKEAFEKPSPLQSHLSVKYRLNFCQISDGNKIQESEEESDM